MYAYDPISILSCCPDYNANSLIVCASSTLGDTAPLLRATTVPRSSHSIPPHCRQSPNERSEPRHQVGMRVLRGYCVPVHGDHIAACLNSPKRLPGAEV